MNCHRPNLLRRNLFLVLAFILMLNHDPGVYASSFYTADTLQFAGYAWVVKNSGGKLTGPGKNYFQGGQENVRVDDMGKLHLRISHHADKWYCSEVKMAENLGYGRYTFFMDPLLQKLDKDVVIGLFVYDHTDTSNSHNEVDIEFSTWGKKEDLNSQYVIQPHEDKSFRFNTALNFPTKHIIEIRKNTIRFYSYYTDETPTSVSDKLIAKKKFRLQKPYKIKNEKVSLNIWLYKAVEPASLKEMEVVFSGFDFSPFHREKLKPFLPRLQGN